VDCPVEVPAWFMGLCGFLGDLPCWMPRGAVIGGKGAGCDWAPCFSHRLNEMCAAHAAHTQEWAQRFERKRECEQRLEERACVVVKGTTHGYQWCWWWCWWLVDDHFRTIPSLKKSSCLFRSCTQRRDRDTERDCGLLYMKPVPLCKSICPFPFFEATPPGAAPGPLVKTGARLRRFRGCKEHTEAQRQMAACEAAVLLRSQRPPPQCRSCGLAALWLLPAALARPRRC